MRLTSIKNLCHEQGTPYHEVCIDEVHSGAIRKTLTSIDFQDLRTPYVYCGLVKDVEIFGRYFVYTRSGEYVFNCQSFQNMPERGGFKTYADAFIEARQPQLFSSYVEEECIFIGGMWADPTGPSEEGFIAEVNFGHFIFEYLNRLAILDVFGLTSRLPVVIYDRLPKRWDGFLEMAGIAPERIIRVPLGVPLAFRKVWVASSCHYRDQYGAVRFWGAGLHWLRFRILAAVGGPKMDRRRIYIGREDAPWRRVVNEDEVMALLARYGIESLPMTKMTAREQVEAVRGADLIVCALGAGSIITHFAPEHCVNIILAPRSLPTAMWGGLAGAITLRQVYDRVECDSVDTPNTRLNIAGVNEIADFKVDLEALQCKIEAALNFIEKSQVRDALKL